MPQAFKLYRIVCTITDKALVSGSNYPNSRPAYSFGHGPEFWYERGHWSASDGAFWKTEGTVRKHIQNLCHDWKVVFGEKYRLQIGPYWYSDQWREIIPHSLDWSRLNNLVVEQFHITEYSTVKLAGRDFMGIPERSAA
jgi:hypothetical protein